MMLVLFFITFVTITLSIVTRRYKKTLIHLGSFWYVTKENELIQYFNLKESLYIARLRRQGRKKVIHYTHQTMRSAVTSDKLKYGETYTLSCHLIKPLLKESRIKVLEYPYIKKKHLWEIIFFIGVFGYVKTLCSKKRHTLKVEYFKIKYIKITKRS